jgi:hypothetical protein
LRLLTMRPGETATGSTWVELAEASVHPFRDACISGDPDCGLHNH